MLRLLGYLFDLIVIYLVGRLLRRALPQVFRSPHRPSSGSDASPDTARDPETVGRRMARDPVCGMFVSTEVSHRLRLGGETLHFCSKECLELYQKVEAGR